MILDCSSYDSAKESIAAIFDIEEESLISLLSPLSPYDGDRSPEDFLYDSMCEAFGEPCDDMSVLWFHGTRVEDESLFYERGILPKSLAREFIEPRLRQLSEGLESIGSNPFAVSISGKQGPHDEGPFAVLIKDVAIHAPGSYHSYVEVPEMVEDIAGCLLGENYGQLVGIYQELASPYVVSFLADAQGYELPNALFFIKRVMDGETENDAGSAANTCFDAEGEVIQPEAIQHIDPL